MEKFLILIAFSTILSCISEKPKPYKLLGNNKFHGPKTQEAYSFENKHVNKAPYELNLNIRKLENDTYDFIVEINLNDDAYFASPNEEKDLKGKLMIHINDTINTKLLDVLVETPLSTPELKNGNVNWVRTDTKYIQKLKRLSSKDFQANGFIQFTIEPRCTLERIPFTIRYSNKEMKVVLDRC